MKLSNLPTIACSKQPHIWRLIGIASHNIFENRPKTVGSGIYKKINKQVPLILVQGFGHQGREFSTIRLQ